MPRTLSTLYPKHLQSITKQKVQPFQKLKEVKITTPLWPASFLTFFTFNVLQLLYDCIPVSICCSTLLVYLHIFMHPHAAIFITNFL